MNNKIKKLIIAIYDFIIILSVLATDWNDWGGVIMLPILFILVLLINPVITWICYRKNQNKAKIILINYIVLIVVSVITYFLKILFV